MYIDSHCHLDFPAFQNNLPAILDNMKKAAVTHALCVAVNLSDFPRVKYLAEHYAHLYASVGVHPDYENEVEPTVDELVQLADHPKVIAIGETGLDYYRLTGDLSWQRQRFIRHIEASSITAKPLIIHTRSSIKDTLHILKSEGASPRDGGAGGVLHCFTENLDAALEAIELGFYISFSGIVTFKNAHILHEVAQHIPLEYILIETDAPYLAPTPYRGQTNEPAFVVEVAKKIAALKNMTIEAVAMQTTQNFFKLFQCEKTDKNG